MQLPTRQSIIRLSLLLSAASSTVSATSRAECVAQRADELAELAACGDKLSVKICLSQIKPGAAHCNGDSIATCYANAGCTEREARIEAEWTLKRCDERPEDDFSDLRRRQGNKDEDDDDKKTSDAKPAGKTTSAAPAKVTTSEAKKDDKKTTDDKAKAASTSAAPAKTSNTPNAPTPAPTSANPSATAIPQVDSGTISLVCSTPSPTVIQYCPKQSTGPESGKKLPCVTTSTEILVCASGNICRATGCMKMDNSLTPAGVVIAIGMGAFIAIAVGATCFFCCRERNQQKKLERAAEAAAIAKAAMADKKRPSVAVRSVSGGSDAVPLMGGQPPVPSMPAGYGANPFGDGHQVR